jgi:hypothetical protein
VQTKGHAPVREHSPPPPPERRFSDYNGARTPPPIFKQPVPHQSEPVKLNPVLGSHPRGHMDRLPPIEAIHGSPPIPTEKRHSQDFFRHSHAPYHPSHRQESLPSHHYLPSQPPPPDRRNSDQSRKLSFSGHAVHERSSSFNETSGRRPSAVGHDKPIMNGAVHIDDAALLR